MSIQLSFDRFLRVASNGGLILVGGLDVTREMIGKAEGFSSPYQTVLKNREGEYLMTMFRPSQVHGAEGWENLLLLEIKRCRQFGRDAAFQADAALAMPDHHASELDPRAGFIATNLTPSRTSSGIGNLQ